MDTSSIPKHVDVIIFGTGLTNSIIAAACSRIGKSVLHLDENSFYGREWASFTLQQLLDWIKDKKQANDDDDNCESVPEELINKSRMFCIDLAPRFLFSNGALVDLLVKSNVARYHEFKNNIRILCMVGDDINIMPCRRNEVFTSPLLKSLSDKRRLMKFIEICMQYEDDDDDEHNQEQDNHETIRREFGFSDDEPIDGYLTQRGLAPNLREHIINSIAMVKPSEPMRNACKKIREFMIATQRYGRSPFLFPIYGCGEFPQSFCRLSAVFGGIYCLNTQIKDVTISPREEISDVNKSNQSVASKFLVKFSDENHQVESDMLVLEQTTASNLKLIDKSPQANSVDRRNSRAILITNKSIVTLGDSESAMGAQQHDKDMISFLRIPPSDSNVNKNVVYLIELNSSAMVCPKDTNLVYLWTQSCNEDPAEDLKPTIERIYRKANTECIMWKYFYHQQSSEKYKEQTTGDDDAGDANVTKSKQSIAPGLYITGQTACDDDIDYTGVIQEAERLFGQMCPNQEFLPRAPDSDEIISS